MGIRSAIGSFVRRHTALTATAVVVGLGLAVFVVVWFEPHKLFVDDRVDEALPTLEDTPVVDDTTQPEPTGEPTAEPTETPTTEPTAEPTESGPVTIARGEFRPLEHDVQGSARILRLADGSLFLRFDDLSVSNGPDLRVYLSVLPAGDDWYVYDDDEFLDLGDLEGNIGDQNYELARTIDLSKWKSAVIWCRRFSVGFAVAPLDPV